MLAKSWNYESKLIQDMQCYLINQLNHFLNSEIQFQKQDSFTEFQTNKTRSLAGARCSAPADSRVLQAASEIYTYSTIP